MIIGISGKIGSGKDTVAEMIKAESMRDTGWEIKKFAGKLKEITGLITGINPALLEREDVKNTELPEAWATYELYDFMRPTGVIYPTKKLSEMAPRSNSQHSYTIHRKVMTYRQFLQILGTEAGRDKIHTNIWVNALMSGYQPDMNWIITDVRFPNEAESVKANGGLLVRVERNSLTGNHPSETALDGYSDWDFIIQNHGTILDLRNEVARVYFEMRKIKFA